LTWSSRKRSYLRFGARTYRPLTSITDAMAFEFVAAAAIAGVIATLPAAAAAVAVGVGADESSVLEEPVRCC